ncbi:MAG: ABC transporter ATP-binding protein/permease, partial [Oscillospiraceae bacterium]|nr:ABC transporter ATP-binding protein/permease [Oscillospiraceae bacterium]
MKLIKYLSQCGWPLLLIVMLLVVQVQCDLALPRYTNSMVDVGISQFGIDDAVPKTISSETLSKLTIFIQDSDIPIVLDGYGVMNRLAFEKPQFDLTPYGEQERASINEILRVPMFLIYLPNLLEELPEELDPTQVAWIQQLAREFDVEAAEKAIKTEQSNKIILLSKINAFTSQLSDFLDVMVDQLAIRRVRFEYTDVLGLDADGIQREYLYRTGAIMLLLTLGSISCAIVVALIASRAAGGVARNLRAKFFRQVLSFSRAEMDKFSPASLVTRSTNDIQNIQMALVLIMRIVLFSPMLGAGAVWNVLQTKSSMSWILGAAVGFIIFLLIVVNFTVLPKFKIMQSLLDRLNLVSREILTGLPVIRAFSRQKHEEKRFDDANRDLLKNQLFINRAMSLLMPVFFFFMNITQVTIIWFSAKGMDTGDVSLGSMMAFMSYTMQIIMSFMMMAMIFVFLPRAEIAAGRINEVLDTTASIIDPPTPLDREIENCRGEISFKDVTFKFPGAADNVLENITFTAFPGKTTAILGGTGSGKSTLVQLIPRLYDVSGGTVTLDGINVRDLSKRFLRSQIGYVPQRAVLFSGTIASNLRFGSEDLQQGDISRAARIAQAADFILEKDGQYGAEIAQGGSNVSGGQRQRLAIARAIAKNPKVYVFDDSFSALDFKTDAALREALAREIYGAAIIIVAQRISTVLKADQIIVLDE